MERRYSSAVVPLRHEEANEELLLKIEEYETLSRAFEKFSAASLLLQNKYEELRQESLALRRELEKKEAEIKRNERLATLGETAAALAHEIRNPLGAMALYTSLLKEDLQNSPDQQDLVCAIDRGISTLNHVVSNILHFAKNSTPTFAPVSLSSILLELTDQYQQMNPEAVIRLRSRGNIFVFADETGLRQLFSNLILNALQAQGLKGYVGIIAVEQNDVVSVRVRDLGSGIPISELESIFEPFTTSKPSGTGLGLAICREICRVHKALLTASNRKRGAQFDVQFQKKPSLK